MREDEDGREAGQALEATSAVWDRDREGDPDRIDRRGGRSGRGRVLVIEAVAERGRRLEQALGQVGLAARVCPDAGSGLHAFLRELPDLVVARAAQADPEGADVLRELRAIADVPVLLVLGAQAGRGGGVAMESGRLRGESSCERERLCAGGARILPDSADGEQIARIAAAILTDAAGAAHAEEATGAELGPDSARPRSGCPGLVTAAEVRRQARSELAAELERQLVACRGNLAEMARRMGKDRSTIRYHLRRFGMLVDERMVRADARPRTGLFENSDSEARVGSDQSSPISRPKAYSAGSPMRIS